MRSLFRIPVLLGLLLFARSQAGAQALDFTLTSGVQTGAPGDTITFMATLANTSPSDSLSLDSSNVNFTASGLTLNDNFGATPLSLDPSGGADPSWTGPLFSVAIDPGAAIRSYTGSYEVDYTDLSTSESFFTTQNFEVDVADATTPEPGVPALLCGFGGAGMLFRCRRKQFRPLLTEEKR